MVPIVDVEVREVPKIGGAPETPNKVVVAVGATEDLTEDEIADASNLNAFEELVLASGVIEGIDIEGWQGRRKKSKIAT